MVWFVCKMRVRHMCTFVSESMRVKGLSIYHYHNVITVSESYLLCTYDIVFNWSIVISSISLN